MFSNREIGISRHPLIGGYEIWTSFLATILKSPFWRRDLYRLPSMIDLSIPFQDGTSCVGPKNQKWSRIESAQIQLNENGLPPLQSHRGHYTAYGCNSATNPCTARSNLLRVTLSLYC